MKGKLHRIGRVVKTKLMQAAGKRPMQVVMRRLEEKGINLGESALLEIFGGMGDVHIVDHLGVLKSVEVWEIDQELCNALNARFKGKLRVRCVDSFKEIGREQRRFDIVVCDNPMQNYGEGNRRVEHFDLIDQLFRIPRSNGVAVVGVIPEAPERARKTFPRLFCKEQLDARAAFYQVADPEHLTVDDIKNAYRRVARDNQREVEWDFTLRRNDVLHYYVCGLK